MLNRLGRHVGAAEGAITIGDHLDVDGAAVCILWAPGKQCSRGQSGHTVSRCALCWIRHSLHRSHSVSTHPLRKTQPLIPGPESTTTYFGGQHLPWEPKDLARGHLRGLLPSLCLAYTLVRERPG